MLDFLIHEVMIPLIVTFIGFLLAWSWRESRIKIKRALISERITEENLEKFQDFLGDLPQNNWRVFIKETEEKTLKNYGMSASEMIEKGYVKADQYLEIIEHWRKAEWQGGKNPEKILPRGLVLAEFLSFKESDFYKLYLKNQREET